MDYRKRIKQMRKEHKWLQKQLAGELGVTPEAVCYWESLKRHPRPQTLNQICALFNISKAELFGAPLEKIQEDRPIYSAYQAPLVPWTLMDLFTDSDETTHSQYIHTSVKGPNNFALKVDENSMETEFMTGDMLVVNPDLSAQNNDFVIVKKSGNKEGFFRQLKKYNEQLVLHALNQKYEDIIFESNKYNILGVLVSKERFYRS